MTSGDELHSVYRGAMQILYALASLPNGATYKGLARKLGLRSLSSVRRSVSQGIEQGLVSMTRTGGGRGGKSILHLTHRARQLLLSVDTLPRELIREAFQFSVEPDDQVRELLRVASEAGWVEVTASSGRRWVVRLTPTARQGLRSSGLMPVQVSPA